MTNTGKPQNNLATVNPELAKQWHPTKNGELTPLDVTAGSNKKVWWMGNCGHEWEAVIASRNTGIGCPYCSGQRVLKGFNDFATVHPELVAEWDFEKNGDLSPSKLAPSSGMQVWWKCLKCGYKYKADLNHRHNGTGCPACAGRVVWVGHNDLASQYPQIAKSWNYEKNNNLKPTDITAGSSKKVWWICEKGHEWATAVSNRKAGKNCPICSGRTILEGYNDLPTLHPELMCDWAYDKNRDLNPKKLGGRSDKVVWWRCAICGNEWKTSISNRAVGNGCPKCARRTHSSFPEQAIYYYIHKYYPDAINGYKELFDNQMELDIFVPSLCLAIEYDGKAWHKGDRSLEKEKRKYQICKMNSIKLIRIREELSNIDMEICDHILYSEYDYNHYKSLEKVFSAIKDFFPLINDVNLERDRNIILENYYSKLRKNSLQEVYPELALEWDSSKNDNITPDMVLSNSTEKYWWKCKTGHSWCSRISDRVKGSNCPYCSNQRLLKGYNDLETVLPNLAEEWNYDKNGSLKPSDVTFGSRKSVWWKCKKGHEWKTNIYSRKTGKGCPFCSGRYAIQGENDLLSQRPDVAREWDYTKNGNAEPTQVSIGSGRKVWWKCSKCGYEWQAQVYRRVKGSGCPKCAKKKRSNKE